MKSASNRRRVRLKKVTGGVATETLVRTLVDARLLVACHGEGHEPMVEVAHETIFTNWPHLREWIGNTSDDLRLRRKVVQAADWDAGNQATKYLLTDERVVEVIEMLDRLRLGVDDLSVTERRFLGPIDCTSMFAELDDPATSHERWATIGVRLSLLGDTRTGVGFRADDLPDISWCEVPGGEIKLEMERGGRLSRLSGRSKFETLRLEPFYIAKYPVTSIQYRAFLDADDDYKNTRW